MPNKKHIASERFRNAEKSYLHYSENLYQKIGCQIGCAIKTTAKICMNCGKIASFRCQQCKFTVYCSNECMLSHWHIHKKYCLKHEKDIVISEMFNKLVKTACCSMKHAGERKDAIDEVLHVGGKFGLDDDFVPGKGVDLPEETTPVMEQQNDELEKTESEFVDMVAKSRITQDVIELNTTRIENQIVDQTEGSIAAIGEIVKTLSEASAQISANMEPENPPPAVKEQKDDNPVDYPDEIKNVNEACIVLEQTLDNPNVKKVVPESVVIEQKTYLDVVYGFMDKVWNFVRSIARALYDYIWTPLSNFVGSVVQFMKRVTTYFENIVSYIMEQVQDAAGFIFGAIVDLAYNTVTSIPTFLHNCLDFVLWVLGCVNIIPMLLKRAELSIHEYLNMILAVAMKKLKKIPIPDLTAFFSNIAHVNHKLIQQSLRGLDWVNKLGEAIIKNATTIVWNSAAFVERLFSHIFNFVIGLATWIPGFCAAVIDGALRSIRYVYNFAQKKTKQFNDAMRFYDAEYNIQQILSHNLEELRKIKSPSESEFQNFAKLNELIENHKKLVEDTNKKSINRIDKISVGELLKGVANAAKTTSAVLLSATVVVVNKDKYEEFVDEALEHAEKADPYLHVTNVAEKEKIQKSLVDLTRQHDKIIKEFKETHKDFDLKESFEFFTRPESDLYKMMHGRLVPALMSIFFSIMTCLTLYLQGSLNTTGDLMRQQHLDPYDPQYMFAQKIRGHKYLSSTTNGNRIMTHPELRDKLFEFLDTAYISGEKDTVAAQEKLDDVINVFRKILLPKERLSKKSENNKIARFMDELKENFIDPPTASDFETAYTKTMLTNDIEHDKYLTMAYDFVGRIFYPEKIVDIFEKYKTNPGVRIDSLFGILTNTFNTWSSKIVLSILSSKSTPKTIGNDIQSFWDAYDKQNKIAIEGKDERIIPALQVVKNWLWSQVGLGSREETISEGEHQVLKSNAILRGSARFGRWAEGRFHIFSGMSFAGLFYSAYKTFTTKNWGYWATMTIAIFACQVFGLDFLLAIFGRISYLISLIAAPSTQLYMVAAIGLSIIAGILTLVLLGPVLTGRLVASSAIIIKAIKGGSQPEEKPEKK